MYTENEDNMTHPMKARVWHVVGIKKYVCNRRAQDDSQSSGTYWDRWWCHSLRERTLEGARLKAREVGSRRKDRSDSSILCLFLHYANLYYNSHNGSFKYVFNACLPSRMWTPWGQGWGLSCSLFYLAPSKCPASIRHIANIVEQMTDCYTKRILSRKLHRFVQTQSREWHISSLCMKY